MNYKEIIKNQEIRFKILNLLKFIPDKTMLKIEYRIKTGRKLNLKKPQMFTEKIQWYKLNYKNPILPKCVDKYEVRDYVKNKGLDCILNELYGVYDSFDEINFDVLPQKFVIKVTNGGGGIDVIICKNKSTLDIEKIKKQIEKAMKRKPGILGREWPYEKVIPRIIVERYIEHSDEEGLLDYKFYCFNGKPKFLLLINRKGNNIKEKSIYDMNFKLLQYKYVDYNRVNEKLNKPEKFDDMIKIAEKLSEDFPFVRVDLYNVNGKIIFGELTFFPASGYLEKIEPDGFDFLLGENFKIESERK